MTGDLFLLVSEDVALGLLILALGLAVIRLARGPTLADRVLALDLLTTLAISLVAILAIRSGVGLLLDIALALCLVGFVATAGLARYLLTRHRGATPATPDKSEAG